MSSFCKRRVLVTGGTGFIGSHLVQRLVAEGAQVTVLVRRPEEIGPLEELRRELCVVSYDLTSGQLASGLAEVSPCEWVFHLAASGVETPLEDWPGTIEANVAGTSRLLEWCACFPKELRAFVYTGTPFEYGEGEGLRRESDALCPPNFYAASKASGWLFCQSFAQLHDLAVVGVRPFLTYGPRQGTRRLVPATIIAALEERQISLTGGTQLRDFVYVDDVVDGLLRVALSSHSRGEMFNLGSGVGVKLQEVVQRILTLTGSSSRPQFGSIPFRKGELWDLRADVSKARKVLGWEPSTALDEGLEQTIAWYRDNLAGLRSGR